MGMGSSPVKKLNYQNAAGGRKSVSPTKSPAKGDFIDGEIRSSRLLEMMMDKCCPSNLAASDGLGADNMSGILIEFKKEEKEVV